MIWNYTLVDQAVKILLINVPQASSVLPQVFQYQPFPKLVIIPVAEIVICLTVFVCSQIIPAVAPIYQILMTWQRPSKHHFQLGNSCFSHVTHIKDCYFHD